MDFGSAFDSLNMPLSAPRGGAGKSSVDGGGGCDRRNDKKSDGAWKTDRTKSVPPKVWAKLPQEEKDLRIEAMRKAKRRPPRNQNRAAPAVVYMQDDDDAWKTDRTKSVPPKAWANLPQEEKDLRIEAMRNTKRRPPRNQNRAAPAAARAEKKRAAEENTGRSSVEKKHSAVPLTAQSTAPEQTNNRACKDQTFADLSFEEMEEVYLKKKRKRDEDDAVAAKRLSFDMLRKIYHERKRQRTTVDLTPNDSGPFTPDRSGKALQSMVKSAEQHSAKLVAVKTEKAETSKDLEDANELVHQQTLTVNIWQGRFDELADHAINAGVDVKIVNDIQNRPLSSGR